MLFKKKEEVSRTFIFEEMAPTKAVLALGIPTVINQLINVIYNLADTFFVGRLDNPSMVAALSLSAPVMITLSGFANLFVVGGCALISKALGQKDMKKAEDIAALCPVMALCIGFLVSLFSGLFLDKLAVLAGATDTCLEYTKEYLKWVFCISAIPNIVGVTLGGGLRGRGYSKYEMIGITSGNVLNIILDPIFVFGLKMGVKGAAVATFISNTFACVLFLIFAVYFQKKEHIYTIKGFKFDFKLAKEVVFTGFPAAFHLFLGSIANVCFMNMVKVYSDACIAGVGIVRKLEHVSGQIVIGLNQGIIPLVSYNYGNKNYDRMTKVRKKALFITTCFGILAVLILLPLSTQFVKLFINDAETIKWGTQFLRVYAFLPLTMSYNNSCRTTFQALGLKSKSMIISVCRNFIFYMPVMYLLNYVGGISGLIFTQSVCDLLVDALAFFMMTKAMKKIKAEICA